MIFEVSLSDRREAPMHKYGGRFPAPFRQAKIPVTEFAPINKYGTKRRFVVVSI